MIEESTNLLVGVEGGFTQGVSFEPNLEYK